MAAESETIAPASGPRTGTFGPQQRSAGRCSWDRARRGADSAPGPGFGADSSAGRGLGGRHCDPSGRQQSAAGRLGYTADPCRGPKAIMGGRRGRWPAAPRVSGSAGERYARRKPTGSNHEVADLCGDSGQRSRDRPVGRDCATFSQRPPRPGAASLFDDQASRGARSQTTNPAASPITRFPWRAGQPSASSQRRISSKTATGEPRGVKARPRADERRCKRDPEDQLRVRAVGGLRLDVPRPCWSPGGVRRTPRHGPLSISGRAAATVLARVLPAASAASAAVADAMNRLGLRRSR